MNWSNRGLAPRICAWMEDAGSAAGSAGLHRLKRKIDAQMRDEPGIPNWGLVLLFLGVLAALVSSLRPVRAAALPWGQEQDLHGGNPVSAVYAPPPNDACAADFMLSAPAIYLPLIFDGRQPPAAQSPGFPRKPPVSKQPGALVPIGDQLGDVGQYYSQVAPSMASTLEIWNVTPLTQTFAMTLYEDAGRVATLWRGCTVVPGSTLALHMGSGQLQAAGENDFLPLAAVCELSDAARTSVDWDGALDLHGIYHAEIAATASDALVVTVGTATDRDQSSILHHAAARYRAIPGHLAQSRLHIPAVLATRNRDYWWDTELVVQNVTGQVTDLQFEFCDERGSCFDNNLATLHAHERRSFLASHLLYANVDGFLEERAGWFSANVTARTVAAGAEDAKVVVLANIFKQPAASSRLEPQAERGSTCLYQAEPAPLTRASVYSTTVSSAAVLRIFNPDSAPNDVTVSLVDAQGQGRQTLQRTLPPNGSSTLHAHDLFAGFTPPGATEVVSIQVRSGQPVVAFAWQDGRVVTPLPVGEAVSTWYAPLVAAPTVEFRWDGYGDEEDTRPEYPGPKFGLAETVPKYHAQRPDWARRLNWYNWLRTRAYCNESVSDDDPYSTYIPMWGALGKCGGNGDRTCVNSPERLQRVRNDLPSNCVGRPLLLANEPDLAGIGAFMTYHELGRLVYQFRSLPGELYSPVFASYAYDTPSYVPEPNAWCRDVVAHGRCPDTPGCADCIRDGIVDGKVDPNDASFKGLEDYYGAEGRWVRGQIWRFEDTIEGMALHFYVEVTATDPYYNWRAGYLRQYRDRADRAGWPIIVSEYGFIHWPNEFGAFPEFNRCTISDRVDDLRRTLQENLGNYQPEHNFNPKKLFWFHTGCLDATNRTDEVCLFQDATSLTSPVGVCWASDAILGGGADVACGLPCPQGYLPLVDR